MQDWLFVGNLLLDHLLLGDGVVNPEFELDGLVLIAFVPLHAEVIVADGNIVIVGADAVDVLVAIQDGILEIVN